MRSQSTRSEILKRLEDAHVRENLDAIESDSRFNTRASSYSTNTELYPDGQIPFTERHLAYLMDHPKVDPKMYLSNLRLMLRK